MVSVSVQFSSLIGWVVGGDVRDDSADVLPQSFLRNSHCEQFWHGQGCPLFDLSIQHFLCRPRRRPPSKVPRRMVLERLSGGYSFTRKYQGREVSGKKCGLSSRWSFITSCTVLHTALKPRRDKRNAYVFLFLIFF